jgi:glycosyltransferase involved in cell wall biosynthesis
MVLVPALNEEAAIGDVVREVKSVVPGVPVLVIDDHSSDSTARVAEEAGAEVVRLPRHLGLGGCLRTGYQIAYELGCDYVIRVDGDGQHEARDIPGVLAALQAAQSDLVIGSRYMGDGRWRNTLARSAAIALFRRLLTPGLGQTVTDPTSGFVGVNRRVLEMFASSLPPISPEIGGLILLRRNRFRFHEIPCRMYPRRSGQSSFTFLRSLQYMLHALTGILAHSIRPELPISRTGRHEFDSE